MSSPVTAVAASCGPGVGMLVATLVTFLRIGACSNFGLMLAAILIGGIAAWWSGKRVAMTAMPQMVALYNGMGGGAAAAIAAVELYAVRSRTSFTSPWRPSAALIGAVSFSGSLIAFAKLQGLINEVAAVQGPASS